MADPVDLPVATSVDPFVTVVYAVGVGLPIALAVWRLVRRRDDRFAWLLAGAAVLWALTSLAHSSDDVAYSIGRMAAWVVEPVLVYLILAFPSGRLTNSRERTLAVVVVITSAVLYLPTAFLAPFPDPSPWSSCGTDCPENAFLIAGGAEGVADAFRPVRELLTVLLWAAVAALLLRRSRTAGPLERRALAPVAWIAVIRGLILPVYLASRTIAESTTLTDLLAILYLLSLPAVALAFAAGLVNQRLFVASALEDLTVRLPSHATAADVRDAMAHSLHDPSLRLMYWVDGDPGRWVDETGWPAALPTGNGARVVTEVDTADGHPVAAIVHDAELARDPQLIRAASSYALMTLENERLARRLRTSLEELQQSRMRIVAAADGERRRIERDLHDGAQQRLVVLRVKLDLLAEALERDPRAAAAQISDLESDVDATIDEVRSFARAVYPPLLAERGLSEALRAAARRAPIHTTIVARNVHRHRLEIESTVYFACVEALQNASKHADATSASISVSDNDQLRFEVHDNGRGFDVRSSSGGAGLTNLRDRLEAIGGTLEVESAPGRGTTVIGTVPNR